MNQRPKFFGCFWPLLICLVATCFSPRTFAKYTSWQAGDIILIRTLGRTATAISQTIPKAPYSHVGLLWPENGKMMVLEVWKKVQKVSLGDFTKRQAPQSKMAVYRVHELDRLAKQNPDDFNRLMDQMYQVFTALENRPYDDLYGLGQAFYCSNFVQHLLNQVLSKKIPSHPMQFKAKFWREYFAEKEISEVPQKVPGIAPGDFARSKLFKEIFVSVPATKPVSAIITPATPPSICAPLFWDKIPKFN
jgi:hypothetical protein